MIIKISEGMGWQLIGDIQDMRYWYQDRTEDENIVADEFWESIADPAKMPVSKSGRLHILAFRKNGRTIGIKTDFTIYVCNDDGKTIEKL